MRYEITVREYDCGCKITSYRQYPSIVYCPKHASAPELYEACKDIRQFLRTHGYNTDLMDKALASAEEK